MLNQGLAVNRLFWIHIVVCCAIIVLVAADEVRVYRSLNRQFALVEIGTVALRCSPDHFYGRRVRVMGEADRMHAFWACHDWRNDQWTLSPIPGASR